jgi:hypothetical protein
MLLDLVFDEKVHEEIRKIPMHLMKIYKHIIKSSYLNLFYLPRIQKIAEPAPTNKSNGTQRQNTAKYCCVIGICRPENKDNSIIIF